MATAIASVATGKPVSDEVAMTGELTLSGQVLPIGGLREKALAAQRAGIKKVIFPRENESDLEELPEETRKELEFIPVDWIQEVLEVAFDGSLPKHRPRAQPILARTRERRGRQASARQSEPCRWPVCRAAASAGRVARTTSRKDI